MDNYNTFSSRKVSGVKNSVRVNKYFSENSCFILLIGQPVTVFGAEQVYHLLRESSNENSQDQYHMMKNLLRKDGELWKKGEDKYRSPLSPTRKFPKCPVTSIYSLVSEYQSGMDSDTSGAAHRDVDLEENTCLERESTVRQRIGLSAPRFLSHHQLLCLH